MGDGIPPIIYTSPLERRNNAKKVLGWFVCFFIAAWIQITPLILIDITQKFFKDHFWIILVSIVLNIIGIFTFFFFPKLRTYPLNKIWMIVMVECTVLGALPWFAKFEDYNVAIALGIGLASFFITMFLAAVCKVPSKLFFLIATIVRTVVACFGMIFFIIYLATRIHPLFLTSSALIYSAMFIELTLLFKLIFRIGVLGLDELHFADFAALIMFNAVMAKIFSILPWLVPSFRL